MLREQEKSWIRSFVDYCRVNGLDLLDLKINSTRERAEPGRPAEIFRAIPSVMGSLGFALLEHGVFVLRDYSSSSPVNLRKFTHLDQVIDIISQILSGQHSVHLCPEGDV